MKLYVTELASERNDISQRAIAAEHTALCGLANARNTLETESEQNFAVLAKNAFK